MERWGNGRPAIGGTAVQHLEQNAQAFNQISANFAAFKLTYIYTHTYLSGRLAQNGLHPDCPDALPTPAQCIYAYQPSPLKLWYNLHFRAEKEGWLNDHSYIQYENILYHKKTAMDESNYDH
ncbi:hypothetical protein L1987_20591 [Smallanthus sonchifolius]|uniref:Uncharacterized protein n=1 Tax=Smallanthus sonchifolius TaxID=185202 RepID=A0ACB9ITV3_9ASTR|nr:hypothetical protein L1987_20591 [Smallanthus sonchifolius]